MELKRWPAFLLCVLLLQPVFAVEQVDFAATEISAADWHVKQLLLNTQLNMDGTVGLELSASNLRLLQSERDFSDISWRCQDMQQQDVGYQCGDSLLTVGQSVLGPLRLESTWQFTDLKNWSIQVPRLNSGVGQLNGSINRDQGVWQARVNGRELQLAKIARLLPGGLIPAGWSLSGGVVSFQADYSGYPGREQLHLQLTGSNVAYSDAESMQAGENMALALKLEAASRADQWDGMLALSLTQGQLYSDPIYLALEQPLDIRFSFSAQPESRFWQLRHGMVDYPGVVNAKIDGSLRQEQDLAVDIQFTSGDLGRLYEVLGQPFLIGTAMDELILQGSGAGRVEFEQGQLQGMKLKLQQADVEDGKQRFGLQALDMDFHWRLEGQVKPSQLSLSGGHLFGMEFGGFLANLAVTDGVIQLQQPTHVPLLGGKLSVNHLTLDGLSGAAAGWELALSARQVELAELSSTLDWPPLSGQLAGDIPSVRYSGGQVKLDGELNIDLFGGSVLVDGLQITDPLGIAPVLESRVRLRDLDLAQLTSAFSLGRIEGLLAGEVDELQLVGWQLNRFKAAIRTPSHDRSRRRISQRAIDNLTSLGTGVSSGLSGTALKVFKDFAYDSIALEVDLAGNMARLDGIPYKGGGYYIVKGAGLPRIDVIGHTHEIAWKDLLSRIQEARFDDMVIK